MTLPEVIFLDETGSTNDDMVERARDGAPHGTAEACRLQRAGRGRRGHAWQSPEGGLYLSVVLRPQVPMSFFGGLPAVCALGVRDALAGEGAKGVALKWPNDVVVGRRKLAGLLVEAGYGEGGSFAVAGIGLNVVRDESLARSVSETQDGSVAPLRPACLADAQEGAPLPLFEELACAIRNQVVARVDAWAAEVAAGHAQAGPLAPVLSEYFDAIPMLGCEVRGVLPDGQTFVRGTFAGIDAWGKATIVTADGAEVAISAEQASLREA